MMFKKIALVAGVGLLAGCASFLPHNPMSDEETQSSAAKIAYIVTCAKRGLAPVETVQRFGFAAHQLLSVSAYNEALFDDTFREYMEGYSSDFPKQMEAMCADISRDLPNATASLIQRYNSIMASRNAAIQGMASSMSSYNPPVQYPAAPIIYNSNQPNFGVPQSGSSNYLINTPNGNHLCNAAASGYVRCN